MLDVRVSAELLPRTENALRLGDPLLFAMFNLLLLKQSAVVVEAIKFNFNSVIEEALVELRVAVEDAEL